VGIAHWDEVEGRHNEKGPMSATWQRLGDAAGARGIGVNRVRVEPGRLPTPPHSHGLSEEIYYVLGGSGLLWQDEAVCEVRAGDTIVQVADHHEHTFRGGPDGLEYLVFGTRHPVEYGWLPRSKAVRLSWPWVEGRTDDPWDLEAEVGELEFAEAGERPANVVALEDVPLDEDGDKVLAAAAGSERSGLNWIRRPAGKRGCPLQRSLGRLVVKRGVGGWGCLGVGSSVCSRIMAPSRRGLSHASRRTPSSSGLRNWTLRRSARRQKHATYASFVSST